MAKRSRPAAVAAALLGAGLGFAVGAGTYTALVPALEAADGIVRELQGLAWNLVPAATLAGGAAGWWTARRHGRDGREP